MWANAPSRGNCGPLLATQSCSQRSLEQGQQQPRTSPRALLSARPRMSRRFYTFPLCCSAPTCTVVKQANVGCPKRCLLPRGLSFAYSIFPNTSFARLTPLFTSPPIKGGAEPSNRHQRDDDTTAEQWPVSQTTAA